jgi:DNA replication protein DnaC
MDRFDPAVTEREAVCPQHGPFGSRNIFQNVWSKCPTCEDERRAAEETEASRQAAEDAERRHLGMLDGARIPQRFRGRSFDNFIAATDAQRHALTVARDFAENFAEHSRKGAGLIMAGRPGTGKSHLAGAILQALLTPNVRYATCMDMIRAVRDTWRRDSERTETQLLGYLECLDLLVIDEVGMQYGTEGEQTILFDVLDRRYREVKPIVILTNQDKAGFKTFVGERTFDRLAETARWVPFDWDSHRPTARRSA